MDKKMTIQDIEDRIDLLRNRIYNIQQKHGNVVTCTNNKARRLQFILMTDMIKLTHLHLKYTAPTPQYPLGAS